MKESKKYDFQKFESNSDHLQKNLGRNSLLVFIYGQYGFLCQGFCAVFKIALTVVL